MLQQGLRLVVWLAVVVSASAAFAEFNVDYLDLDGIVGNEVESNATFVDVLDTPSAMTPLASRSLLNGIARAGNRLVAVGARGHILYSDDEGKSWKQAKVPVSSDLTAVNFSTPQQGWAVGHDGVIVRWTEGAWKTVASHTTEDLNSVAIVSAGGRGWNLAPRPEGATPAAMVPIEVRS